MENEQITEAQANAMLFAKMARIMGKVHRMKKTGLHKHFKYAFVTDGDVSDTIRELMAEENLAVFAEIINYTRTGEKTHIQMVFTFACGDTGATRSCSWFSESDDGQDKGMSKAATLGEKFFLLKTFLMSTGDPMDDPDSGMNEGDKQSRKTTNARAVGSNGHTQPANGNLPPSDAKSVASNGNGTPIKGAEQFPNPLLCNSVYYNKGKDGAYMLFRGKDNPRQTVSSFGGREKLVDAMSFIWNDEILNAIGKWESNKVYPIPDTLVTWEEKDDHKNVTSLQMAVPA